MHDVHIHMQANTHANKWKYFYRDVSSSKPELYSSHVTLIRCFVDTDKLPESLNTETKISKLRRKTEFECWQLDFYDFLWNCNTYDTVVRGKETSISVWQNIAQIEPPRDSELIFDGGVKNPVEEKYVVFNSSWGTMGHPHCRKWTQDRDYALRKS